MTTAIQLLRSPVANLRPIPGTLDDGMPMVNTNAAQPGLFFKTTEGTALFKVGPAAVGPQAPNAAPAGFTGNSLGEFWYDTLTSQLKLWNGAAWVAANADTTLQLTDLLGVSQEDDHLGSFSGATIANNSTIKEALQLLETKVEAVETALNAVDLDTNDFAALVGLAENVTNLGTFTGATIADGQTVKAALQALETRVETCPTATAITSEIAAAVSTGASLHLDDVRTALGIAEEHQDFGTFSGTILGNNKTLKQLLEQLEDGIEARANPAVANTFLGEHTLRDKLHIDPGDGGLRLQLNRNVSATQFDILLGDVPSGARLNINTVNAHADDALVVYSSKFWCRALSGGTGAAEFDGNVQVDGSLTVGSTNIITELGLKATSASPTLTGDVSFDTNKVFYKSSTGRLGIGTTAPGAPLDLLQSGVFAQFRRSGGSSKLIIKNNTGDDGITIQGQVNGPDAIRLDSYGGSSGVKIRNEDGGTITTMAAFAKTGNTFGVDTAFSGNVDIAGNLEIDNDGGYYLKFDRNTSTQLDIITGNIPSGGNLNIKNSNGTDAKVVVYSDLFWCRNLGGSSGNGSAQFDGDVTLGSELKMSNDYTNKAAAGTGALGDIAVIGGALCFHDGTDWKTVTLGSAPS